MRVRPASAIIVNAGSFMVSDVPSDKATLTAVGPFMQCVFTKSGTHQTGRSMHAS